MNRHQHERTGAGGLSSAILPWAEQPERVGELRQFLSGFTHRCRNSLHGIKMSLYLCRRGIEGRAPDAWARLEQTYQETERLFDRLQEIYRPMRATMVRSSLGQLLAERLPVWRSWFTEQGLTLEADPPAEEGLGDYDPMHLGSGLDALIAWRLEDGLACRSGRLAWRVNQGFFEVEWSEVDRQVPAGAESRGQLRSERSGEFRSADSLALPLLARIASAHGGRVLFRLDPTFQLTVLGPQFQAAAELTEADATANDTPGCATRLDGGGRRRLTSNCGTERGA